MVRGRCFRKNRNLGGFNWLDLVNFSTEIGFTIPTSSQKNYPPDITRDFPYITIIRHGWLQVSSRRIDFVREIVVSYRRISGTLKQIKSKNKKKNKLASLPYKRRFKVPETFTFKEKTSLNLHSIFINKNRKKIFLMNPWYAEEFYKQSQKLLILYFHEKVLKRINI